MSDHEFERQVQQSMDELKLRPSNAVWQGVSAELDREKRRRRALLWIPVGVLLLGAASFFAINQINSNSEPSLAKKSQPVSNTSPKSDQKPKLHSSESSEQNAVEGRSLDISETTSKDKQQLKAEELIATTDVARNEDAVTKNAITEPSSTNIQPGKQTVARSRRSQNARNHQKSVVPKDQADVNLSTDADLANASSSKSNLKSAQPVSDADKTLRTAMPEMDEPSLSVLPIASVARLNSTEMMKATASTPAKKTKQNSKHNKWQFGVNAGVGFSNIARGDLFNINSTAVSDVAASAGQGAFSPAIGVIYKPSEIEKGIQYSAGVFATRVLSPRWKISAGINYSQYNAKTKIGSAVESTRVVNNGARGYSNVSQYYTPEQQNEYKMRYEFLELPVLAQFRLNRGVTLPIYVNAGLNYARLLRTNALHFDGSSGVYYNNNTLFNKNHLGLITGVSVDLFSRSKHPLSIGPSLRYQLTNLLHKDVSASRHLVSFGIDARFLIKK